MNCTVYMLQMVKVKIIFIHVKNLCKVYVKCFSEQQQTWIENGWFATLFQMSLSKSGIFNSQMDVTLICLGWPSANNLY